MTEVRRFAGELARSLMEHRTKDLAAQLAFWSLLAVFPFCIFLLTMIGYIPLHGLDTQVLDLIDGVMPEQAAALFTKTLHEVVGRQRGWLLFLSLAGAIWSASGGMGTTIHALNRAWGVDETRSWWRVKLLSLTVTLGAVGAIIVATVGLMVGPSLLHDAWTYFGVGKMWGPIWRVARWPVIVLDLLFMLACLYHLLPNVKRKFHLLSPGSVLAVPLWIGVSLGFNSYVSHFNSYARTYGALGTAVVLLVWLYLSSLMVIVGGEINATLDRLGTAYHKQVVGG